MKVMIRVPNWVGDAVMAVPALRELRRIFAGSHITLVARPWVAGLFDGEALADDLISVREVGNIAQKAKHFMSDTRRLRRERFDLAILFPNSFGAALMARLGRSRKVAGYARDGRRALLDYAIAFEKNFKALHQVRYYLNIAAGIERTLTGASSVEMETAQPVLRVAQEQKEKLRQMLEESGIERSARIVAINPGATNSRAKQWLAPRFAQTADQLSERDGFQAIIIGAAGDRETANEVAQHMRTRAVVLAGRTSITELKAALACSSLVLSNDTGTAHVSAALRVPTVVVFGPTEHISTRPLSSVAVVVRHPVECSPCMLRECPIDHRCMTGVKVSDVYLAAQELLVTASR
ncbi:MAG: lipopolysaccharide heptosyltransferase II [Blastocatellia bacterium]